MYIVAEGLLYVYITPAESGSFSKSPRSARGSFLGKSPVNGGTALGHGESRNRCAGV